MFPIKVKERILEPDGSLYACIKLVLTFKNSNKANTQWFKASLVWVWILSSRTNRTFPILHTGNKPYKIETSLRIVIILAIRQECLWI